VRFWLLGPAGPAADSGRTFNSLKGLTMNTPLFPRHTLRLLIGALFAAGAAHAATLPKAVYDGAKDDIKAAYKSERDACSGLAGNAKDICIESAKGREKVALARLEFDHTGKAADEMKWHEARYEARYDLSKERCDDLAGDRKDLCVQEAKTARDKAKADLKLAKKVTAAIDDADSTRMKADYKLARERCEPLSGAAKDVCVASAKARYEP
jgi:hypothetical protein